MGDPSEYGGPQVEVQRKPGNDIAGWKYAVVQGKNYTEMETRSRAKIFEEVQNIEQGA